MVRLAAPRLLCAAPFSAIGEKNCAAFFLGGGLFRRRRQKFWRVFRQNVSGHTRPIFTKYVFIGRHLVLLSLQIA